jgi:hypothetical protein
MVPDEFKTQEMWDYEFEKDNTCFEIIPKEFMTLEMCKKAIKFYVSNIHHTPESLRQELWNYIFELNSEYRIPDKFMTDEMRKIQESRVEFIPSFYEDEEPYVVFKPRISVGKPSSKMDKNECYQYA